MFRRVNEVAAEALAEAPSGWDAVVRLVRHCAEPDLGALSGALRGWLAEHRDRDEELRALTASWLERFELAVHRAQDEGAMRRDIGGADLLRFISLVTCRMPELPIEMNRKATARYIEVLIDGLRAQAD
jgi:hypothetical protein